MTPCYIRTAEHWTKSSIPYHNKVFFLRAKQRQKDKLVFKQKALLKRSICVYRQWNNAKSSHHSNDLTVQQAMSIRHLFQLRGITSVRTMDTAYCPKSLSTQVPLEQHILKREFYHLVISQVSLLNTSVIYLYSDDETANRITWAYKKVPSFSVI